MSSARHRRPALMAYIVGLTLAFPAVVASLPGHDGVASPARVAVLIVLGLLAGARPVRIPGMRHEIQATHPFILFALATLGPRIAVVVAVAGVIGALFGRGRRPAWMRLGFNIAAVGLSTAAAAGAFAAVGGQFGRPLVAVMLPLFVATTAYLLCNTGFVAIAISLDNSQPLVRTWYAAFSYTLVSYFAGLTLAVAMLALETRILPWGLLLAAATYPMFLAFYRSHASTVSSGRSGLTAAS